MHRLHSCIAYPSEKALRFDTARVVAEDNDLAGQSLALGAIVTFAPGRVT
jgi:hypothetical protein